MSGRTWEFDSPYPYFMLTKEQQRKYAKAHYAANRELYATRNKARRAKRMEALNKIKAERGPCVDCGVVFHPYAMDFDHTGNDKVADVSDLIQRAGWQRVLDEIAKCELVCANCHRVRTYNRFNGQLAQW
jgi:hypothetical protein